MVNEDVYLNESVKDATLEDDQFGQLREALQKTVKVVETIPELYRLKAFELAFPFVYKTFGPPLQETVAQQYNTLAPSTGLGITAPGLPSNLTANEFLLKASPTSHVARFVCIGYYLLHTGKADQFTIADILDVYGKLRQPKPGNPADVISQCIRKAHITDAESNSDLGNQKSWVITPTGEQFVEGLLEGVNNDPSNSETPKTISKARKGVQRGRKSSTPRRRAVSNPSA